MNNFTWTFVADNGKKNHIGLMHGAKSGHLLVYCNTEIMIIDFQVLQSKTYSLFIEDELCEISIERKGNQFLYGFEINKDVDTPKNRERKKLDRKHLLQSLLFLGTIIALTFSFYFIFTKYNSDKISEEKTYLLHKDGEVGLAKVFFDKNSKAVSYTFVANGEAFSGKPQTKDLEVTIASTGMPLENGDEFEVLFASKNPKVHKISLDKPSGLQIQKYKKRAIAKELEFNKTIDETMASCMVDVAFAIKGMDGLADFYHQQKTTTQNAKHNQLTYKRLVRDIPFKKAVDKNCW